MSAGNQHYLITKRPIQELLSIDHTVVKDSSLLDSSTGGTTYSNCPSPVRRNLVSSLRTSNVGVVELKGKKTVRFLDSSTDSWQTQEVYQESPQYKNQTQ